MSRPPPWLDPRTAYVHIPFCAHHCGYCDFAVATGQDQSIEHYLDALAMEMQSLSEPRPVETLFIGGGTPTYLSASQLEKLLRMLNRWLPLPPGAEYSMESTPESLTREKAAMMAAHGVTRVSIGIQSFRPELLAALDRRHTLDHIPLAVECVREYNLEVSFDLIFAAPGSTLASWESDLRSALAHAPRHLSTYGLTYEKGTPLWKQRSRGLVMAVEEDDELAMFERGIEFLTVAGFEHYEISNFARPGFRCRHNERYWANEAYYGFGVGAARYVDGVRELNTRDTKIYLRRVLAGESPTFQRERLNDRDRAFETIGTQLRRREGIQRERFREQTGLELENLVGGRVAELTRSGHIYQYDGNMALTRLGICVADAVIEDLMKANA